jgi:EmrB/QacA subfamily drug resistance transporter
VCLLLSREARKAAAAESARTGVMTHRQILMVLFGLMSGMFLSSLDQSIVGSAMRTIADDLKGLDIQAWVTTAYLITSTITTPIYGKLGDLFGRRRLFIFAISVFVVASVGASFSTSMYELAAWRALQGVGAGGLFTLALTVMADIVPPRERARYMGMFMAVFGTSSVLGPLVGGLFAGADQILWITGWRWVFLINLPIGVLAMFMVVNFLHIPHHKKSGRIDWWGAVSIIIAVVPLLIVAEQGRDWGWDSANSITAYVIGGLGIIAFIFIERSMGEDALLPLKLFKSNAFTFSTIIGVIVGVGMFGGMMTIPLILQIVYGANPTEAGLLMLPMVLGMMTASILSGRLTQKTGKYKWFMISGTAFMTASYFFLSNLTYNWQIWQVSIGMVVLGMGLGQLMQTLSLVAQNSVEAKDIGVATSSATFFRQMGGTVGVAVFLSILFTALKDKGPQIGEGIKAAIMKDPSLLAKPENAIFKNAGSNLGDMISKDSSFLKTVSPELGNPIKQAFAESAVQVFASAAVVVAIAFILTWFVKEVALRTKSGVQEQAEAREAAAASSMH